MPELAEAERLGRRLFARCVADPKHPGCISPHPGRLNKDNTPKYATSGRYRATLIAWIVANGTLPPSTATLMEHACHNAQCVNPEHLTPGDDTSNARSRVRAGRNGDTRRRDQR